MSQICSAQFPARGRLYIQGRRLMEERREPSTWYVATVAMCLFVGLIVVASMFGGTETVAVAAQ